jgi:hypothetical protein
MEVCAAAAARLTCFRSYGACKPEGPEQRWPRLWPRPLRLGGELRFYARRAA